MSNCSFKAEPTSRSRSDGARTHPNAVARDNDMYLSLTSCHPQIQNNANHDRRPQCVYGLSPSSPSPIELHLSFLPSPSLIPSPPPVYCAIRSVFSSLKAPQSTRATGASPLPSPTKTTDAFAAAASRTACTACVAHHTSVTRHVSHVTRHVSHVTRHTSIFVIH